jgi:hypothetical protein
MAMASKIPAHPDQPYGFMEREVAFKLIASHAMVDAPYFEFLRKDPVAAAAELHIALTPDDVDYLQNHVDWDHLARQAPAIREALNLDLVTNSW